MILLAGFVPGRTREVRMPFIADLPPESANPAIRPLDTAEWIVRFPLGAGQRPELPFMPRASIAPSAHDAARIDGRRDGRRDGLSDLVNILTKSAPRSQAAIFRDMNDLHGLFAGDALAGLNFDDCRRRSSGIPDLCPDEPDSGRQIAFLSRGGRSGRFARYRDIVDTHANKLGLNRDLVYAIIQAESGFNPRAISRSNARGLMQIVPRTAGGEVHAYLHGRPGMPNPASLFLPAINIQYGMTYLHLLMRRHLSGVTDPLSREYCAIAAYNTGPSALLGLFGAERRQAVAAINALSSQQVYSTLLNRLPALETRMFLRKVLATKKSLSHALRISAR
jgi:hypothetical protein